MGVKSLTGAFRSGQLSPVEVTNACLARAEAVNPSLNAFTVIDRAGAATAALAAEGRWRSGQPLSQIDGVPTTIKDIVQCHGLDVRYGSSTTEDISQQPDAPSVKRLREAGAVIIGLTVTPEFGWKAVTDNRKDGITRNPWNTAMTPGGSSGGAAVAAAVGAGVLHLGTDGGGSIRIPAAFTGIVGHKPSFGQVAAYPASSFGTVAHIGPMARTVEDIGSMLNVMKGRDLNDWTQPSSPFDDVRTQAIEWLGKRIGYWKLPCVGSVHPEVTAATEAVLKDIELAGGRITEIELPDREAVEEIFYRHWYVGAANRLSSIDPLKHDLLDPGFLKAAEIGAHYSAVERMKAEVQRAQFGAKMDALFETFDYIISPTVPIYSFEAGHDVPPGSGLNSWIQWSSFSFPINLSQQPACSIPSGRGSTGLPIGMQIIAARGQDTAVLSAALTYQRMYPERFLTPEQGNWPRLQEAQP